MSDFVSILFFSSRETLVKEKKGNEKIFTSMTARHFFLAQIFAAAILVIYALFPSAPPTQDISLLAWTLFSLILLGLSFFVAKIWFSLALLLAIIRMIQATRGIHSSRYTTTAITYNDHYNDPEHVSDNNTVEPVIIQPPLTLEEEIVNASAPLGKSYIFPRDPFAKHLKTIALKI